ncbi:two pore domain potassium channel family protein [Bacillus sp. FJAT-49705]|uniref:Two pore domain potassium channel family protein n=1 Tax=Cytobacillus citreus TaxID=2833586 RepID=A0ABS5NY13_9BACI|nr:two pore domain potassium channel family protein [Cytobacillus citreus]MBS4192501.1 two pore domain potassium channel family protein [Cytobacillus citreus]
MVFYIFLVLIVFCMIMSLRTLFIPHRLQGKKLSFENFMYLAFIYVTLMLGFGLIYILLEFNGYSVFMDGTIGFDENFLSQLETGFYFSAVTLFSVGYGDIAPIGIGRMISVLEALIGYTIPAAFVFRAVFDMENKL